MTVLYETDLPNLKKDMESKAVINTDLASLNRYKLERKRRLEAIEVSRRQSRLEEENKEIKEQLNTLNNAMIEILALLKAGN